MSNDQKPVEKNGATTVAASAQQGQEGKHAPSPGLPSRQLSWWEGDDSLGARAGNSGNDGLRPQPPIVQAPSLPTPQLPQFPEFPQASQLGQLPTFGQLMSTVYGVVQPFFDAVTGLATAASKLPFAELTLPAIVSPAGSGPAASGGPARVAGVPSAPRLSPSAPVVTEPALGRLKTAPLPTAPPPPPPTAPTEQQPAPSDTHGADNELLAAPTYRMGYVDYLRAAGTGKVAAVAVPGFTGILVLTSAGGLIGYRQARAGRGVGAGGTARFMS